ncbi:MAG: hypothetical protein IJ593_08510 [Lachnospiraceae bacterium]|nr:hypothetical protein [Lachnospiraceae bacterium]
MADNMSLFSDNGKPDNIAIPTCKSDNVDKNLISSGVEDALKGETVKSILIPEDFEMMVPNYVIDFTGVNKVMRHQLVAISDTFSDDGDTAIYAIIKGEIQKLGMANGYNIDRIIVSGINSIFNGKCKLYQDVERDKPLKELSLFDIHKIRLNI